MQLETISLIYLCKVPLEVVRATSVKSLLEMVANLETSSSHIPNSFRSLPSHNLKLVRQYSFEADCDCLSVSCKTLYWPVMDLFNTLMASIKLLPIIDMFYSEGCPWVWTRGGGGGKDVSCSKGDWDSIAFVSCGAACNCHNCSPNWFICCVSDSIVLLCVRVCCLSSCLNSVFKVCLAHYTFTLLWVSSCFLKLVKSKPSLSLKVFNSLLMLVMSVLEGVDAAGTWMGFSGLSFLAGCIVLLKVKREVMTLNADCIMMGCILGYHYRSFTISIQEPSDWLISTWCSAMGLIGVVIGGMFGSMEVLFEGPFLWTWTVCTLFLVFIEFHKSIASMWVHNVCKSGKGFLLPSDQIKPSVDVW